MRNFFNQYQDFLKEMLRQNSFNYKLAKLPVQLRDPIYGKYKEYDYNGFRDFMIPEGKNFSLLFLSKTL